MPGTIHAEAGEEVMWGFAECSAKKAMEVEFGEARLASCVLEQNPGLVFAGKEVPSATEPSEGIVMEKLRHPGIILPLAAGVSIFADGRPAGSLS